MFQDFDLAELSNREYSRLRQRILWIGAESDVPSLQTLNYVAMPLLLRGRGSPRDAKRVAWEALDRVGMSTCARRWVHELSRWERLLVELARGFAIRPQLMIVDDLLDNLGWRTREAGDLSRSLVGELGCGILLSATSLASARIADSAWRLDQGIVARVVEGHSNLALADELHEQGHKDAAAVIVGSTLENHLRRLAAVRGIRVRRDDGEPLKGNALNGALAREGVYGRLQQKYVTAWLDLRNDAAHGRYWTYDAEHVAALLQEVSRFVTRYPAPE